MAENTRPSVVAIAFVAATFSAALSAAPNECKVVPIDEWQVKPDQVRPTIRGAINGRDIDVLLDTGATLPEGALLERAAARRLGIPITGKLARSASGLGGETGLAYAKIDEFRIGQAKRREWSVIVAGEDHGLEGQFILGSKFFAKVELEFDLPHNMIRIFRAEGCAGLAYWTWMSNERPQAVPIWVADSGQLTVEVEINNTVVRAMVDSGASTSLVEAAVAARAGVTANSPDSRAGAYYLGAGQRPVPSCVGQFASFAIGEEKIANPKFYFADLRRDIPKVGGNLLGFDKYQAPEMLLGADFLRTHRVLISRPQGKMFFTYVGGKVFPTESRDNPCDR